MLGSSKRSDIDLCGTRVWLCPCICENDRFSFSDFSTRARVSTSSGMPRLVSPWLAHTIRNEAFVLLLKILFESLAMSVLSALLPADRFADGSWMFTVFTLKGLVVWFAQTTFFWPNVLRGLLAQSSIFYLLLEVSVRWETSERIFRLSVTQIKKN